MLKLLARAGVITSAALTAVLPAAAPATAEPARPAVSADAAEAAAGWLARQLTGDAEDHFVFAGGDFADVGLTIDAILAFDAAGVASDAAGRAGAFVQKNASSYVGFGDERYPGSYAKLLLLAEAQGLEPTSFGGLNLVSDLTALECGAARTDCAATPGRFANRTGATYDAANDFSSPLTQALAVIALKRTATADPSEAAVTYLLSEACPDGGYPSTFTASRAGSPCAGDLDVTGFVIQALYAVGRGGDAQAAVTWLSARQRNDGSFAGSGVTAKPNANSTAVAAQALRVAGQGSAAARAVRFLETLQAGCDAPAGDRGRIEYDKAASGDPARATAQAVPALAEADLASVAARAMTPGAPTLSCAEATTQAADLTRGGSILADSGADTRVALTGGALTAIGVALLFVTRRRPEHR